MKRNRIQHLLRATLSSCSTSLPIGILIVFFGLRHLEYFGTLITDKIIAFFRVSWTGRSRVHCDRSHRNHHGSMMQMGLLHDFRGWHVFGQDFLSRDRYRGGSGQRGQRRFIGLVVPAEFLMLWLLCGCNEYQRWTVFEMTQLYLPTAACAFPLLTLSYVCGRGSVARIGRR